MLNFAGMPLLWLNIDLRECRYLFYLKDIELNVHCFDLLKWQKLQNRRAQRIHANRLMKNIDDLLQNINLENEFQVESQLKLSKRITNTNFWKYKCFMMILYLTLKRMQLRMSYWNLCWRRTYFILFEKRRNFVWIRFL